MSRDAAFWTMVIGFVIPGLALGWLRGRAIGIAYRRICSDLSITGIELSQADLQQLMWQLTRNPRSALVDANNLEAQAIRKRHVESLVAYDRSIRRYRWLLAGLGIVALILFQYLWPNK